MRDERVPGSSVTWSECLARAALGATRPSPSIASRAPRSPILERSRSSLARPPDLAGGALVSRRCTQMHRRLGMTQARRSGTRIIGVRGHSGILGCGFSAAGTHNVDGVDDGAAVSGKISQDVPSAARRSNQSLDGQPSDDVCHPKDSICWI